MKKLHATNLAQYLLKIKAVQLNPKEPFTWASGIKSPIYNDNRKLLSDFIVRELIVDELVKSLKINFENVEYIAGVATGGIAWGVLIAESLGLPFVYVRSQAKSHGLKKQIEGILPSYKTRVVVVEDLVSTGKSSLSVVDVLREHGADVLGILSLFSYDLSVAQKRFEEKNCKLISLSTFPELLEEALKRKYINEEEYNILKEWHKNPENWYSQYFEK